VWASGSSRAGLDVARRDRAEALRGQVQRHVPEQRLDERNKPKRYGPPRPGLQHAVLYQGFDKNRESDRLRPPHTHVPSHDDEVVARRRLRHAAYAGATTAALTRATRAVAEVARVPTPSFAGRIASRPRRLCGRALYRADSSRREGEPNGSVE